MAKYQYRMGNGLAIRPEKDMQMFGRMSAKGWHLTESHGFLYRFEQGEPHAYIYALCMDMDSGEEMYPIYEESGWTPVIREPGMHIFRAEKGTAPIFSDTESKVELMQKERRTFGFYALGWGLALVLCIVLSVLFPAKLWAIPLLLCWVQFVFGCFPFVGLCRLIRQETRKEHSHD